MIFDRRSWMMEVAQRPPFDGRTVQYMTVHDHKCCWTSATFAEPLIENGPNKSWLLLGAVSH